MSLIDQLGPGQRAAIVKLLEVMVLDDEDLSEEERRAVSASRRYFRQGNEGYSFEQVVAECGFTMEQVLGHKAD